MTRRAPRSRQSGLTYIEIVVATLLMSLAMVPAINALQTGLLAGEVSASLTAEHYAALSRMEEVLAEPYALLRSAAETAGNETTATGYSDAPGTDTRCLVYLGLYDAENADGDGNRFSVADPDLDGDANPFTGYAGPLWVRVEVEGAISVFESLAVP